MLIRDVFVYEFFEFRPVCVSLINLVLRSDVLMFRIPNINQCDKNFLRLRKVEFIKWINLINVLFIGFVISNGSRLTKTNFVFGLVSLDCGLLENCFCAIFWGRNGFIFLFPASICFSYLFIASTILFLHLSFAQSCKILAKFSKLSTILKHRGKNFAMMTSIVHLSSNRS